jgi:hypothetical protein
MDANQIRKSEGRVGEFLSAAFIRADSRDSRASAEISASVRPDELSICSLLR